MWRKPIHIVDSPHKLHLDLVLMRSTQQGQGGLYGTIDAYLVSLGVHSRNTTNLSSGLWMPKGQGGQLPIQFSGDFIHFDPWKRDL